MGSSPPVDVPTARPAALVRALHSFEPTTAGAATTGGSCLSFEAGQLIRCLNKDPSGWWDGQVILSHDGPNGHEQLGERGWFPSNYVEELADEMSGSRSRSVSPTTRRSPTSSRNAPAPSSSAIPTLELPPDAIADEWSTILDSIRQAIALLRAAVQAERKPHYQPSTACVISSIRTVLSSTNCLTRESPVLRSHPSLASSRKRILSALAALVNQARKASSPTNASSAQDANEMLELADRVLDNVRNFLDEARRCEVKLLPPSPAVSGEDGPEGRKGSLDAIGAGVAGGLRPPRSSSASPSPSLTDSSSPSPSSFSTQVVLHSPLDLHQLLSTQNDALLSTIAAFIGHVHAHTRASHSSSYAQLIDLTRETIEKVREVLVVVEGVSGLLRSSQAADLEQLEGSRERLYVATTALVTAARVATAAQSSSAIPSDSPTSAPSAAQAQQAEDDERRSLLASATAVLRAGGECVSAVKACVPLSGGQESDFELVLDFERVKMAPSFANQVDSALVDSVSTKVADVSLSPSMEAEEDDEVDEQLALPSSRSGKRQKHTISMLGRKATSLSCLRDMYAPGNGVAEEDEEGSGDEPEDGVEDQERRGSEATVRASTRPRSKSRTAMARERSTSGSAASSSGGTVSSANPAHIASAEANPRPPRPSVESTDSLPMSRVESSRTSASAASSLRSGVSRASTADTSPRSSLNTTYTSQSYKQSAIPAMPTASALANRPSSASSTGLVRPASTTSANGRPSTSGSSKEPTPSHLSRDYEAREISFNADGHVTGGTLRCLVERMTLHDTTIDPTFANTFFLTFRMFTTPLQLAEVLYRRFEISPPEELTEEERKHWERAKLTPVRLRIYNLFKTWLETYWMQESDGVIVEGLLEWCRTRLASAMASASVRLVDLIQKRVIAAQAAQAASSSTASLHSPTSATSSSSSLPLPPQVTQHRGLTRMQSTDRFRAGKVLPATQLYSSTHAPASTSPFANNGPSPPAPILGRNLITLLRNGPSSSFSIIDIDPLELARQLTIMESRVYCSIRAEELLGQEFSKKGGAKAENVRAMSTLSTRLTGWITETILQEQDAKKRTSLLKYFVKLSDRCFALNNYNTLFAVLAALNSSTITRLKKTWDGLAPKYRQSLDHLRKATEHTRNYAEYRGKIRSAVPPCLPFVGLFLTDITMCSEGNPAERPSPGDPSLRLINFDRYQKMARIVGDLQRFQVAYNLLEVPEIQSYLARALEGLAHGGDASSLYRQSLLVEPRDGQNGQVASSASSFVSHHRGDFFNWKG